MRSTSELPHPPLSLSPRSEAWWLAGIILLGFALRLNSLFVPIRFDEITTLKDYAAQPLLHILSHYGAPNNHVFHSLLVHFSISLFGDSLWALRLPALISGILIIPATWWLVRQMSQGWASLAAALLVAVFLSFVDYSVNARGYTLLTLLLLLHAFLGVRLFIESGKKGVFSLLAAGFILTGGLALWTIPTALYGLAGIGLGMALHLLLDKNAEDRWRRLAYMAGIGLVTGIVGVAFYLPIILSSGFQSLVVDPNHHLSFVQGLGRSVVQLYDSWLGLWGSPGKWIAGILSLIGVLKIYHWSRVWFWICVMQVVAGVLISWILTVIPFWRIWLPWGPFYAALVGIGMSVVIGWIRGSRVWVRIILGSMVVLGTKPYITGEPVLDRTTFPQAREVANYLNSGDLERPAVLLGEPMELPMVRYYLDSGLSGDYPKELKEGLNTTYVVTRDPGHKELKRVLRICGYVLEIKEDSIDEVFASEGGYLYELPTKLLLEENQYLWSHARTVSGNTKESSWFGKFNDYYFPEIHHEKHGWLYCMGDSVEDIWLWDKALKGYFWTSQNDYPEMIYTGETRDKKSGRRLKFDESTARPNRRFRDLESGEWVTEGEL